MYTQSTASPPSANSISRYYHDVYGSPETGSAQVEFSIAYGHVSGSGSIATDRDYPTKAIYGQYRTLLLSDPRTTFTLSSGSTEMIDFVAINIKRANLKQKLDAGNWELHLTGINGSELKLIDNSNDSGDTLLSNASSFAIVSGSIDNGAYSTKEYGIVYPDYGVILLSPTLVSQSATFNYSVGNDSYKDNAGQFFSIMSASSYFAARSEELISSTHYFVRVKNLQYNYSTNPTFYSASDGTIIEPSFYDTPKTFITTVGLYNENNELLAVAKLSKPIEKGFDKEALFKCRLDF